MATTTITSSSTAPSTTQIKGDGGTNGTLIRPHALCHVVIQTTPANYQTLVDWYLKFTGGRIAHATPRLTFMSYDHEHHRIAIAINPKATGRPSDGSSQVGVHHVAFGFKTLQDLANSYEQKKALGILPVWCVNHGISMSMYYEDPDGNRNELQVDNFDTPEEAVAYMESSAFEENPIGVDYDPEEFVKKVRAGVDEKVIKERPDIGRRAQR